MRTNGEHIDQEKNSGGLPQKRGVKNAVVVKKWDRSENLRKPSMEAAWVEWGAVTSTIAAGSPRRIDRERGEKRAREIKKYNKKKDQQRNRLTKWRAMRYL